MESITEPTKREVELEEALEVVIDILEHKKADTWRAENMEKVRAYSREKQREYYARNREKILAKRREQYDTKNPIKIVHSVLVAENYCPFLPYPSLNCAEFHLDYRIYLINIFFLVN